MLRRRIRSALYIDFENVPLPADSIANWLAWLEDGVFEASHRWRRFLQKRVYWNSHAERNRELFLEHGFTPILVGKFAGLKNGADIRMAMDVIETTYTRSEIDEYILLTGDSDFVPVLERLRVKAKRSAIVATEHRPNIHTTYQLNADVLIPSRRLVEAAQYRRPQRSLADRLLLRRRPSLSEVAGRAQQAPPVLAGARAPPAPRTPAQSAGSPAERAETPPVIDMAARRVVKLMTQQPRNYVAQKRVVAELERVQGLKRQGPTAFFGFGSYKTLMKELARIEPRITVIDQPGGGTGVVFIPRPAPGDDAVQPDQAASQPIAAEKSQVDLSAALPASQVSAPSPPPVAAPRPKPAAAASPPREVAEAETA